MKRPLLISWFLGIAGYMGYGISVLLFIIVILPLSFLLLPLPPLFSRFLRVVFHSYIYFLTRVYLPFLRIYRIREISGFDRVPKGTPVIYIANHRSRLDGLLILGTVKNLSAFIKSRYAASPLYSSFVRFLDFISIDPSSIESLSEATRRSAEVLAKGTSLLIFPEGTRTNSPKMLPFKDFAFKLALENGVAIVPVIIYSDQPFMTKIKGSHFPKKTFSYWIRCLEPLSPNLEETPTTLSERIRKAMDRELQQITAVRDP